MSGFSFPIAPPWGWYAPYIGAPYREGGDDPATGWDCWGLYRTCLARHFGASVPDYDAVRAPEAGDEARARAPAKRRALRQTRALAAGAKAWSKIARPCPGAAVLILTRGRPLHVGLALGRGLFLHVDRKIATVIERLSAPEWTHRLEGFYVPAE